MRKYIIPIIIGLLIGFISRSFGYPIYPPCEEVGYKLGKFIKEKL